MEIIFVFSYLMVGYVQNWLVQIIKVVPIDVLSLGLFSSWHVNSFLSALEWRGGLDLMDVIFAMPLTYFYAWLILRKPHVWLELSIVRLI